MDRQEVSDAVWERIEPHLSGKASDPGRTGRDNRLSDRAAKGAGAEADRRLFTAAHPWCI
jgi:transposase